MKKIQESETIENRGRRDMLLGAAVVTTLAAGNVMGASGHEHHEGHMMEPSNRDTSLIDAALHCVKSGQICNDHCIELVKKGDTSIAECLASVSDMLVTCEGLSRLAANNSKHLAAFAKVCISVCKDCERACAEHENHHAECRACAQSCRECIKACEKVAA